MIEGKLCDVGVWMLQCITDAKYTWQEHSDSWLLDPKESPKLQDEKYTPRLEGERQCDSVCINANCQRPFARTRDMRRHVRQGHGEEEHKTEDILDLRGRLKCPLTDCLKRYKIQARVA